MKTFNKALFLGLVVTTAAFASKFDLSKQAKVESGVLSIGADWLKDKDEKFDVKLLVQNKHDQAIIILAHNIRCFRGTAEGDLHLDTPTGSQISFHPGQTREVVLLCKFHQEHPAGKFRVVFDHVYENSKDDGETKGKSLGKSIEWTTEEEKKG